MQALSPDHGPGFEEITVRLGATLVMTAIVGFERELSKSDTAGLRTNLLIGITACAYALITLALIDQMGGPDQDSGADQNIRMDPIRLVEAVTAGVAVLAAGVVVFTRGRVRGVTTGAGMWLSASIGLATGLGYWAIAVFCVVLGVFALAVLRRVEHRLGTKTRVSPEEARQVLAAHDDDRP